MVNIKAKLIKKTKLNELTYDFVLKTDDFFKNAVAGQFINVLVEGFTLRRPFSICEILKDSIRIVFSVKGQGTKKMATWQEGKLIDIIGPLGNGFKKAEKKDRCLLVGGGIGAAPLLEFCKQFEFAIVLAGFNCKEDVVLKEDFEKNCKLKICTKDGSLGEKGLVTDYVLKQIEKNNINRVAACGPKAMLEIVAKMAKNSLIFCEISLEERMACGIGACLACQYIIKKDGQEKAVHICKDGPVFVV